MKVKELIRKLQNLPQNAEVTIVEGLSPNLEIRACTNVGINSRKNKYTNQWETIAELRGGAINWKNKDSVELNPATGFVNE